MNSAEYENRRDFLLAAISDAEDRGDWNQVNDAKESLTELIDSYYDGEADE